MSYLGIYKTSAEYRLRYAMVAQNKGGVVANSTCLNIHSKRLVYFRYLDHAEVYNATIKYSFNVIMREAIGWIIFENDLFLVLISNRSIDLSINEARFNVLVIIKSDIIEFREIK